MITTDTPRAEAVAWLVGRLRFERLLADLQHRADGDSTVDVPAATAKAA